MDSGELLHRSGPQRPVSLFAFLKVEENRKYVRAAVAVLTLAVNGGCVPCPPCQQPNMAVLTLPGAFASTGVVCAAMLLAFVAFANVFTNNLLLWQALACKQVDLESLCAAVAGPYWMLLTEIGLVVLMLGSLVSGIQQFGETVSAGVAFLDPSYRGILTDGHGRFVMIFVVVCFCAPLVYIKGLKQLEAAGDVGVGINQIMVTTVVVCAVSRGLPELGKDHEFEIGGFSSPGYTLQLLGTLSYCMYVQPFSLVMLSEMPSGARGVRLLSFATTIAVLGTAFFVYFVCGFFGAALFGREAYRVGNILENDLGSGLAQGALNLFFTVYLILSTPPTEHVARHALMKWWATLAVQFPVLNVSPQLRKVTLAFLIYGGCLCVSVKFPDKSSQVIAVTGAVGSGLICYIVPAVNHLLLYFGYAECSRISSHELNDTADDANHFASRAVGPAASDAEGLEIGLLDGGLLEGLPEEIEYRYPCFADDGCTAKSVVIHIILPSLMIITGAVTSLAVLANFNYV